MAALLCACSIKATLTEGYYRRFVYQEGYGKAFYLVSPRNLVLDSTGGETTHVSSGLVLATDNTFEMTYSVVAAKDKRPAGATLNYRETGKWSVEKGVLVLSGVGSATPWEAGDKKGLVVTLGEDKKFAPKGTKLSLDSGWFAGGRDKAGAVPADTRLNQ